MSDENERYVARIEFRKDATFTDTRDIVKLLREHGYNKLTENVTSGSVEVREDQ